MSRNALRAAIVAVFGVLAFQGITPLAEAAAADQQAFAPDLMRDVQRSLNQKGYRAGPVDGVFGETTRAAIARFQRDSSLPHTGQIDRQTLAALGITGLTARTEVGQLAVPRGQMMSARMVEDVQGELQRLGYDVGRVDGRWGSSTSRALTEFQRDHNLVPSGRIDEQTLAALEAGGATQTGQLPPAPRAGRR